MVRVRLERNISGRAFRSVACLFECVGFRVLYVFVNIEAFAQDLTSGTGDNAANERSRTDLANAAGSKFQRPRHQTLI
jgi:hypothetical protein